MHTYLLPMLMTVEGEKHWILGITEICLPQTKHCSLKGIVMSYKYSSESQTASFQPCNSLRQATAPLQVGWYWYLPFPLTCFKTVRTIFPSSLEQSVLHFSTCQLNHPEVSLASFPEFDGQEEQKERRTLRKHSIPAAGTAGVWEVQHSDQF